MFAKRKEWKEKLQDSECPTARVWDHPDMQQRWATGVMNGFTNDVII